MHTLICLVRKVDETCFRIGGKSIAKFFATLLCVAFGSIPCHADSSEETSWSRFRGPNGTGVLNSFEGTLPWNRSNVVHRIDLHGSGNGSPALWVDLVFLQVFPAKQSSEEVLTRQLVAVDKQSGTIKWQRENTFKPYTLHKFSSYASSTPCVDADRVYNVWGSNEALLVEACTHDGELLWSRNLGTFVSQHGFGSSPMLAGEFVILFNSQDALELPAGVPPGKDTVVALNKATGEIAWETEFSASHVCYGVPSITQVDGKAALIGANTNDGFFALDATTGAKLFTSLPFGKRVVCSTSFNDDVLVASEGSGGGGNVVVALDRKNGNKEKFRVERAASYVPSTVIKDNLLFIWSDNGIVSCVNTDDGETLWSKRIGGNFSASPIVLGDKLINVSHEGVVTVLRASNRLEELSAIDLEEPSRATIAATNRQIVLRTDMALWIIGKP